MKYETAVEDGVNTIKMYQTGIIQSLKQTCVLQSHWHNWGNDIQNIFSKNYQRGTLNGLNYEIIYDNYHQAHMYNTIYVSEVI